MKCAIYTRTSKDELENPRLSNKTQEEVCREKAMESGDEIVKVYSDIGRSGSSEKLKSRKEFLKMIEEAKELEIKRVWFLDLSRFSRSGWQQEMFIYELEKIEVDFMPINDSKEKLPRQITGIMNENLIDVSRKRVEIEHSTRLKKQLPVSRPPRGYKVDKKTKKWIVDNKEAEVIKKIFEIRLKGIDLSDISKEVNIIIPTLKYILKNKAYIGIYTYKEQSFMNHEPLINEEVFNKCQK